MRCSLLSPSGQRFQKESGTECPFSVNGLSVADLGISKVSATGVVYDLQTVSDFSGSYVAVQAGAAVGAGGGGISMRNQNGVVMNPLGPERA